MRKLLLLATIAVALPAAVSAQAGPYPALQPSQVAEREYNFVLADYDGGSALVAQWREGLGNPRLQFTGELGLADGNNDAGLIIGGSFHYQITRATQDMPFDMVLGGGLGLTTYDNVSLFRIPVGVAIGHRFPLEGNFAITPFVHPRIAINRVSVDTPGGDVSDTESDVEIDIGASFELNTQMQIRLGASLGDNSGVAVSFAWLPRGLRR